MKIWVSNSAIQDNGTGYVELHVRDILGEHYETWYFDTGKRFVNHKEGVLTKKRKRKLKAERKRLRGTLPKQIEWAY